MNLNMNTRIKGAIVMPAGSGKTTLSKKYKYLYDIDSFHSNKDHIMLSELYENVKKSGNWDYYNEFEISLIKTKIEKLQPPFVVLLHCREKSDLLNLHYMGSCKTSNELMDSVATERGLTDALREEMTRNNWKYCNANIFDSYEEIEEYVVNLCKIKNINICE